MSNASTQNKMANKPALGQDYPNITKSTEILNKAKKIMQPVSQTLAKSPGQYSKGVAPVYLDHGKGAHVWDVDGNEYIDFNMAIGPLQCHQSTTGEGYHFLTDVSTGV